MQPTLRPGDFIFCSRISYGFSLPFMGKKWAESFPSRGDLVVFSYPNQPDVTYVKRVVGLPGDKIQILNGRLVVNDHPLKYVMNSENNEGNPNSELFEIYKEISEGTSWPVIFQKKTESKDFGPLVVPPGEIFLLGDNRDASDDSRYWGTVPVSQLVGEVVFIWLSLDWQNKWGGDNYPSVRWERVFSRVH
jgi:signal peptidase I